MARALASDEVKTPMYAMATAGADGQELVQVRRVLRSYLLPGQRSVHCNDEKRRRRWLIESMAAELTDLVTVTVHDADGVVGNETAKRRACLHAIVADLCRPYGSPIRMTLHLDESQLRHDRQVLLSRSRRLTTVDLTYAHLRMHEEPLLWVADAAAWCYAKGGIWLERISPLITQVIKL